jgi:hypothetical protein
MESHKLREIMKDSLRITMVVKLFKKEWRVRRSEKTNLFLIAI